MIFRKLRKRFLRWFDGSFSKGWLDQVAFLTGVLMLVIAICYSIAFLCGYKGSFLRIIELLLDPGAFAGNNPFELPIWLAWVTTICGAVFFTAMLITVIGNIVSNRINDFKKGLLRYDFDDHILILGANSMLVNMLKELAKEKDVKKRKIVILTNGDTEVLKDMVEVKFPKYSKFLDITYMYGHRELEETLGYVQVDEAHSIYILGEEDEIDHDSKNIQCWRTICKLCKNLKSQLPCYMVVDRMSSFHVFQFSNNSCNNVKLTIINSLENWAQRVLVAGDYEDGKRYPSIIGKDSSDYAKDVRFVVFGMSQMACTMATTVAHIVHKPGFKAGECAGRTKISFVQPGIVKEMNFFKGHYESLFKLSHSSLWTFDGTKWNVVSETPDSIIYGDFLDVEWEFIDGSIEEDHVRDLICGYAVNENEFMSITVCHQEIEQNVPASLYLPGIIYEKQIPVFVYQPDDGDILKMANETSKYRNVFPFGMKQECYDPLFKKRLEKAKKINYLYNLQGSGKPYLGMPSQRELDELWSTISSYVLMSSNVYAANSIPIKLQLMGWDPDNLCNIVAFTEKEIETLAEMEHNRWNMEKLLMGFSALTIGQREAMKKLEDNEPITENDCSELEWAVGRKLSHEELTYGSINKELKSKLFKHKDITPYRDLSEDAMFFDKCIVKNLADVYR